MRIPKIFETKKTLFNLEHQNLMIKEDKCFNFWENTSMILVLTPVLKFRDSADH